MDVLSVWDQFEVPYIWTQMEYLLRILIAAFLGLLIGNERKNRNKSAGIRTHAIVALGAALMMVVSKYGFLTDTRRTPPVSPHRWSAEWDFWARA